MDYKTAARTMRDQGYTAEQIAQTLTLMGPHEFITVGNDVYRLYWTRHGKEIVSRGDH